ncbi:MAG: CO dehydrogenase/acetyl-CoA synthase complex subunit epsilon [Candidatus Methylarchaceae archaeon HK02M2]|nr:CO dehydrogenase/acetyl-CoA synthase complex subunit epsilon [Candidatus Methylarchaceae archaeon HK02M2]
MSNEPWQIGEIAGPKKALIITKPSVVVGMVKKAKRTLMVVGHQTAEIDLGEENAIDYMIKIADRFKIPIVATANAVSEFVERNYPISWMSAMDIGNRLQDPEWEGLDGKGQYDLVLFIGIPYYMEWTILSGLKHTAPNLKTISLDRYYHPHASWSFSNIKIDEWVTYLKTIIGQIEEKA